MIVKGLDAINKILREIHMQNRKDYYQRNTLGLAHRRCAGPNGVNMVGDHDEDYVFDALFDVPNR